jgi:hypothetical protein
LIYLAGKDEARRTRALTNTTVGAAQNALLARSARAEFFRIPKQTQQPLSFRNQAAHRSRAASRRQKGT